MKIGFRYEFTSWFVVIFERIRFGVPPPLFFVCGIGFGRCCRFVGFLFKLGVDLRALVRQNAAHVVNLIIRAHTNRNPAIGSSASRRGFLFERQYDGDHFLIYLEHDDVWNGGWILPVLLIRFGWLIHSEIADCTFCLPSRFVVRAHWLMADLFWMFYLEYDDVRNGFWRVGIDPND